MRRLRVCLLAGCLALTVAATTTASAGTPTSAVSLTLPAASLAAGQQVSAVLVNRTSERLQLGLCATLARRVGGRWVPVTHSHGVDVACSSPDPVSGQVRANGRQRVDIELYDDLAPGTYRVTLPYREARFTAPPLPATSLTAAVTFALTRFDPGPAPQLGERRLLAIALTAAAANGDADPTLIQHAEGTRALAALIASDGDLVDAWNWSYLIAERGRFTNPVMRPPAAGATGPGHARVHFSVITLVVNARTGEVTDSGGGGDRYPNLAELGPVLTDRS